MTADIDAPNKRPPSFSEGQPVSAAALSEVSNYLDRMRGGALRPEQIPPEGTAAAINPDEIGSTGEAEAADTQTWDIEDQGEFDGVESIELTRFAFDHTGDSILYAYYRTKAYGVAGNLLSISAETRVIIDTPEDCA